MVTSDIMTANVVTSRADASVREIAEVMSDRNVGSVVIVDDNGRPIALVTDRDLTVGVVAQGLSYDDPVSDHATQPLVTSDPGMEVEEAAGLMMKNRIRRLPIVDGESLVGIVTLDDLAARTGNLQLARSMTIEVTKAVTPDFYFLQRD